MLSGYVEQASNRPCFVTTAEVNEDSHPFVVAQAPAESVDEVPCELVDCYIHHGAFASMPM
ncbi:hypothetical protein SAMN04488581_0032 [Mycolicibacterium neoaurum]|nr:hypothetical protein SAMN04488581_0032 [Mycolicibacterium neoaurum]